MKIGDLARKSGLSAHTIRYYERIGLLPYADRDGSGHRDYDDAALRWLEIFSRLKTTGMSLRNMLHYAELARAGDQTFAARFALLRDHRQQVAAHIEELQACLRVIDTKIAIYGSAQERTDNDQSQISTKAPARKRA